MSKDLEIIRQLEKQLKTKIPQLRKIDLYTIENGYDVDERGNITDLSLCGSQLTDISAINGLTNLTTLDLYNNQLTDISAINGLTNLTSLYLSINQISDISPLKGLMNLTLLYLSRNQISDISSLKLLTNLTTLGLNENQIKDISCLENLKNLTSLYLSKNQIKNIYCLVSLANLSKLDLRDNQIKKIPTELIKLEIEILWEDRYFEYAINLFGNPIEIPPIEIIKQGKEAVRNYFESIEKETSRVFEAKLLIVGEGGVGKTCLMKRLMVPNRDIDKNELTTKGIEINQWMVQTTRTNNFRINFWDFGGQEIYHATHQFFLTKRSLYLFVWDARTDDNLTSFDYWLNVIKLLSDNSPVIIVLNKIDERIRSIDEHSIQTKFQNIVAFDRVSALEAIGIEGLTSKIEEQIAKLPHIGDVLPTVWIDIRKKLESLDTNFISCEEYKAICSRFSLDGQKAEFLSRYYHDLGVFLHFQDNPVLREIVFLKPDWATNAVYKLIDTKEIQKADGKFHFDQLKKIWNDYPQDKYAHLLELMKKFELCFQIPGTQYYIVPELLRPSKPDFKWKYAGNLRFEYRYDFMPAGIITRFIVRTHDIIERDIYWKNGVVLQRENTKALIVSEQLNRKISIWVRGENRKELLAIIRREIDYIHETLNEPVVKQMVPCICSKCAKSKNPYFFDYETVCRFRSKGIIPCAESTEDVPIEILLGDYETPEEREIRKDKSKGGIKIGRIDIHGDHTTFADEMESSMKINHVHVEGNVTFADKIGKIVYNQNLGITKEQFSEFINAIKKLPADKQSVIEKDFAETAKAKTEEQKKSICEKIKRFLIDNGIPIAHSFAGSAILELAKMVR